MAILELLMGFFETHYYLAYLILFLGSFVEILVGVNFFIYGEFFFLSGAILAGAGVLNIWLVALACISGGILGDSSSFYIGWKHGHRLTKIIFKKGNKYLTPSLYRRGVKLFHSHGKKTMFFARFMGPMAWITPFLAGTFKIRYPEFLKYNIPSAILGISEYLIIGYFLGKSYTIFLPKLQKYIFFFVVIAISIAIFTVLYKMGVFDKIDEKIFGKKAVKPGLIKSL